MRVTLHRVKRRVGAVWQLRWYTHEGKRRGEVVGEIGKMTTRQAQARQRDKQGRLDCKVERPDRPGKLTLDQLATWDRLMIADRRHKTLLDHDHAIEHARRVLGADVQVDRLDGSHVARIKADMQADYRPATIDKTVRCLRAVWNRALKAGKVTANPFSGSKTRWDPRPPRIYSAVEVEAMIAVADDWMATFVRLAVTTGLRLNESLHLRWDDVDLDGRTVRVCRHDAGHVEIDGRAYPMLAWSAKARASYRVIPLTDDTVATLMRWKAKAGRSPYVFIDLERLADLGARLEAGTLRANYEPVNNVLRRFGTVQKHARKRLAEQRGVEIAKVPWAKGCIHDLRDTALTAMKGLPLDVLQRVAGHSDIATTIRYYTSATERDADQVRAALAASGLSGGGSGHAWDTRRRFLGSWTGRNPVFKHPRQGSNLQPSAPEAVMKPTP